jgi:hypothetical protein
MLKKNRDKMNLKILGMLRQKGAPSLTPFPGEQGFESEDVDDSQYGDVVRGRTEELIPEVKKKKKKVSIV